MALGAAAVVLSGCSSAVEVSVPPAGGDAACGAASAHWPATVSGMARRDTTPTSPAVAEIVSPDEVHHWGMGDETSGFEAFTETFAQVLSAFPDISFTVDLVAAEGDLAATAWTANATQTGEWLGIAPTNAEVTFKGINVFRIECGRIAEVWSEVDALSRNRQLTE